jgi:hypothetical protein
MCVHVWENFKWVLFLKYFNQSHFSENSFLIVHIHMGTYVHGIFRFILVLPMSSNKHEKDSNTRTSRRRGDLTKQPAIHVHVNPDELQCQSSPNTSVTG